jgi:hypothetical protein
MLGWSSGCDDLGDGPMMFDAVAGAERDLDGSVVG